MTWRTIETAPRDGSSFIGHVTPKGIPMSAGLGLEFRCRWRVIGPYKDDGEWCAYTPFRLPVSEIEGGEHELVAWMPLAEPLPPPPTEEELTERCSDYQNRHEIFDATPDCDGVILGASGGGVKCSKCSGWFCY